MTIAEMEEALKSKRPVIWQGRMDYETMVGQVTGILRRYTNGQDVFSAEVTSIIGIKSVMLCRPTDISFWSPVEHDGKGQA